MATSARTSATCSRSTTRTSGSTGTSAAAPSCRTRGSGGRRPGSPGPTSSTSMRGRCWWFDKKVGFRGGVYEGVAPIATPGIATTTTPASVCVLPGTPPPAPPATAPPTCVALKRNPQFAYFVNLDLIGSEEGGWLYGAYKWGKAPIVSIGTSGVYQSQALKNAFGNLADQKIFSADVYVNFPQSEDAELVLEATGYLNRNGSGSL